MGIPRRKAFQRAKTGCLTCRQRRKKCDELRPTCTGCARNFIPCSWPPSPLVSIGGLTQGTALSCATIEAEIRERALDLPTTAYRSDTGESPDANSSVDSDISLLEYAVSLGDVSSCELQPIHDDEEDFSATTDALVGPCRLQNVSRATSLAPNSLLLLQHYVEATSTFLVAKPRFSNPFLTVVLPLAFSDDLLMHSVLALSGTHLAFRMGNDLTIQLATRQHRAVLLRELRKNLAVESTQVDVQSTLRLLVVLMVLCHVEAISGEPDSDVFPHLRASRQIVLKVLQREQRDRLRGDAKLIQGFALEVYYWLVLVNRITPHCLESSRAIPFDPFFDSLDLLRGYDTFGIFLHCGQGLFEMIPKISALAMRNLAEEETNVTDPGIQTNCTALDEELVKWRSPPVAPDMVEWEAEHIATGEIYRQALLIFLRTAMCGSVVSSPKVIATIQHHIDISTPLFGQVSKSPFNTLLLWPVMIVGSCLISEHQRSSMIYLLEHEERIDVRQVREAARLLACLWEDEDEQSYGPVGLQRIMKKCRMNFSVA